MLVFCDEGVSHGCRHSELETFAGIYSMFEEFHYAKILLHCIGCYISGNSLGHILYSTQKSSGSEP